jgi:hypothetical protein
MPDPTASSNRARSLPARAWLGAHSADFRPPWDAQAFTCDRDQAAAPADAQVGAHLDRPLQERARYGQLRQREHFRHVGLGEADRFLEGRGGDAVADELQQSDAGLNLPASRD